MSAVEWKTKVQDLMALAYHLPNQLHHVDRSFYFRREPNLSMEAQLRQNPADLALPKRSASETSSQPRTDFKLTVKVADGGRQFYQTDSRTPSATRGYVNSQSRGENREKSGPWHSAQDVYGVIDVSMRYPSGRMFLATSGSNPNVRYKMRGGLISNSF